LTPWHALRYLPEEPVGLVHLSKLLGIAVNTMVLAPAVAVTAVVDANRAYDLSWLWAQVNLLVSGVGVRTTRRAPLDATRSYVFMSNHASHFDALALVAALPEFQLRWVAKRELADLPVFGWALRNAGHIVIDRSNPSEALATLREAKRQMDGGVSVMIFPEGTRATHDRELLPLKKGGFVLALETGAPIVPVAVRGSRAILASNDWHIHDGEIEVVIGAPIPVAGADRETLMSRVRAILLEELGYPADPAAARAAEAR